MREIDKRLNDFSAKSRIIKRFNPNDSRTEFGCPPRLCINTYVGCSHQCTYCYNHWMKDFNKPHEKKDFEKSVRADINNIFKYGLDNLIVSISNSTDPLQEGLETKFRHTLFALKVLKENNLKVLITSKNPITLLNKDYLEALNPRRTVILVTIPFAKDNPLEAQAPSIESRLTSVQQLIASGFKTSVRIDPLIPAPIGGQSQEELHELIRIL
jgi:DNA repair photolyase